MNKKYFKSCIALVLAFTILCCGAVSASAYSPIVTIKSSDWNCTDTVTGYKYPNNILIGDDEDAFRQYDELYGETCYFSSDDDVVTLDKIDVEINPDDFQFDGFYVFERYNRIYLINYEKDYTKVGLDADGYFYVYVTGSEVHPDYGETVAYNMEYPYNQWGDGVHMYYGDGYKNELNSCSKMFVGTLLYPTFTNSDVFYVENESFTDSLYCSSSTTDIINTVTFNVPLSKPLKVYAGAVSFSLTATQIQQFSLGRYAFLFNNTGLINGYDCSYACAIFQMNVYDSNLSVLSTVPLINNVYWDCIGMTGQTKTLSAYSASIEDFIVFWENDIINSSSDVYTCMIAFVFISDVFSVFFPGTIEIIEYESYESDMEHSEILGAVDEAASLISGEISSASSALSQEIVNAASDIKDSINNSSAEIITAVNDSSAVLSDKLEDVKDSINDSTNKISDKLGEVKDGITDKLSDVKDGITNKLTEIKDNLLDGIKSFFIPSDEVMEEIDDEWDELLKTRFGALYEVSGIITDFASEMSWDFVEQAGEKNTIIMPSVTVKLVDTDFSFGGYEVKVVPDGFDVLTTALKGITSIVCTLLFVNALRRKYDKLVGGGSA